MQSAANDFPLDEPIPTPKLHPPYYTNTYVISQETPDGAQSSDFDGGQGAGNRHLEGEGAVRLGVACSEGRLGRRERRLATATGRRQPIDHTLDTASPRPHILGMAVLPLAKLAIGAGPHTARNDLHSDRLRAAADQDLRHLLQV